MPSDTLDVMATLIQKHNLVYHSTMRGITIHTNGAVGMGSSFSSPNGYTSAEQLAAAIKEWLEDGAPDGASIQDRGMSWFVEPTQ